MDSLISNLIRPFRFTYSIFDLGNKITEKFQRTDSYVYNERGYRIEYSYYKNINKKSDVCFLYSHCNSGCRVEGLGFVDVVMENGWDLCLFDFCGSGLSEGEHISLGYYEAVDLEAMISEMKRKGNKRFMLWGRSMGAATIILYLASTKRQEDVVCCVLDSPYSNITRTIKSLAHAKTGIPNFLLSHVMSLLQSTLKQQHNLDLGALNLLHSIPRVHVPCMFLTSENDTFIQCEEVVQLYERMGGKEKALEYIEEEHNSPRDSEVIVRGVEWMTKCLKEADRTKRKEKKIMVGDGKKMAEKIIRPLGKAINCPEIRRFHSFSYILNQHGKNKPANHDSHQQTENYHPNLNKKDESFYHNISAMCYPVQLSNQRKFNCDKTKNSHIKTEQVQESDDFVEDRRWNELNEQYSDRSERMSLKKDKQKSEQQDRVLQNQIQKVKDSLLIQKGKRRISRIMSEWKVTQKTQSSSTLDNIKIDKQKEKSHHSTVKLKRKSIFEEEKNLNIIKVSLDRKIFKRSSNIEGKNNASIAPKKSIKIKIKKQRLS